MKSFILDEQHGCQLQRKSVEIQWNGMIRIGLNPLKFFFSRLIPSDLMDTSILCCWQKIEEQLAEIVCFYMVWGVIIFVLGLDSRCFCLLYEKQFCSVMVNVIFICANKNIAFLSLSWYSYTTFLCLTQSLLYSFGIFNIFSQKIIWIFRE